jgi:hypothetical protein
LYKFDDGEWQTANTATVTITAASTYKVKAKSSLGCESLEATTAVAIEDAPTGIALTASSTTVCKDSPVTLTATSGATSYQFNDGEWQTANTATVTVSAATVYKVKAKSLLGCESGETTAVAIEAAPTGIALSASSTTVCKNSSVTLTASATGASSYSFDGGTYGTATTTTRTVSAATTYKVKARSLLGCESGEVTTAVAIEDAPTGIALSASSTTVCKDSAVTLTANATGASSYSFDGGTYGTATTTTRTVSAASTYRVKAKSSLGCESSEATRTVAIQNAPTITLTASPTTVCKDSPVTLTASTGASSYQFNGGAWQSARTTTVTVDAASTYKVKGKSAFGCEGSIAEANVKLYASPGTTSITGSANTCPAVTFTLTATVATDATSYTWYDNGAEIQSGTSTKYTGSMVGGSYTVRAVNSNCQGKLSAAKGITINKCTQVLNCGSLNVLTVNSASNGSAPWATANDACITLGGRLPTISELVCLCKNKATLFGGLSTADYWSSSVTSGDFYACVPGDSTSCNDINKNKQSSASYRCVK